MAAVLAVLAAALWLPSHPRAAAQDPASSGDVVALHFLAIGSEGAVVEDLRPSEVSVRIGGRARPVVSLQFVPIGTTTSGPAGPDAVPPAFATNSAGADGRALLILVADESIGPGDDRRVRESLSALVDALSPRDRIAIVTVPHGGVRLTFTDDRTRVRQAIEQITGRASRQNALLDLSCQSRQTLEAVGAAASSFRSSGLPVVLVVAGGLMGQRRELERIGTALAPSACDVRVDDFQAVARAALPTQAHFWIARAETAAATGGPVEDAAGRSSNLLVGLEQLAGATGAPLINLTGSDGTLLERVARESAGYYVAGVAIQPGDRGAQPRSLDVRVARAGVAVRSPIEIGLDAVRPARPAPMTPDQLLTVAAERRDLSLRAVAYVTRESASTLRIAAMGEASDASVTITAAAIGLVDGNNRLAGQWAASADDLPGGIAAAFAAPPGRYRIRVAAIDALGRAGTVDYLLTAELSGTPSLEMSDLFLGVTRETGFAPRLSFLREPVATAYVEIYGAPAGANIHAVFEVSASANGPAILAQPAAFTATDTADKFIATAALPIGALPPGEYVVRATMGLEGQPTARVMRVLKKAARPN